MASVKLQKIGNSYGFRIPQESLRQAGFRPSDRYEVIEEGGALVILKSLPPGEKWTFREPDLSAEDDAWLEADLGKRRAKR